MLRRRRNAAVVFGLASTADTTSSPSIANVTGTRWGTPSASAVASRATRAVANNRRATEACMRINASLGRPKVAGAATDIDVGGWKVPPHGAAHHHLVEHLVQQRAEPHGPGQQGRMAVGERAERPVRGQRLSYLGENPALARLIEQRPRQSAHHR